MNDKECNQSIIIMGFNLHGMVTNNRIMQVILFVKKIHFKFI